MQLSAHLVDLGVILVAVVVGTVLQRRNVRVVADKAVVTAATEVLLRHGLGDGFDRPFAPLSNLGLRYGFFLAADLSRAQVHSQ